MLLGDMMVLGQNHLPSVRDDNSHDTGGAGWRMCLISAVPRAGGCGSDSSDSGD